MLDIEFTVNHFLSALEDYCAGSFSMASVVSDQKSYYLIGVSLQVMRYFSPAAFKSFSLSLVFRSFIMMCLGMDFFSIILLESYPAS